MHADLGEAVGGHHGLQQLGFVAAELEQQDATGAQPARALGHDPAQHGQAVRAAVVGARRLERERVLSLLYEAEMKGETLSDLLSSLPVVPEPFVVETVTGVDKQRDELDIIIAENAANWALDRMASLDLNIMRIGTWELLNRPEINIAVIVSEAVELAKRFSTDESGKFVNGILASVATAVRLA